MRTTCGDESGGAGMTWVNLLWATGTPSGRSILYSPSIKVFEMSSNVCFLSRCL